MKTIKILKVLCLFGLWLGFIPLLQAHDPGLSRANVVLNDAELVISMTFALQDLELLTSIDTDHDRVVNKSEFSTSQEVLRASISQGVILQVQGKTVPPKLIRVRQVSDDAVNTELHYDRSHGSQTSLQIPLLKQLARGHRQYITVNDADGNLLLQQIVNAGSEPVALQASGVDGLAVFQQYLSEGIWHIWIGFDHILFLLTLLLPAVLIYRKAHWRPVKELRPAMIDILKVVTAFTVSHSITLALGILDIVNLPPRLVESVIAISVLITAVNNLRPIFPGSRWQLAFGFGLIHGFGFASVLGELGLPVEALVSSLAGFNLGVEVGQLAIVILVFPVTALLRHSKFYRHWIFNGGSVAAALLASIWLYERVFDHAVLGF